MDQKKTGEFLRELRKGKGITQEKAAEQFSVSCRTVSRWETGVNMPDIGIIKEIADFYEVDIRDIINGERSETASGNNDTVSEIIEYAGSESNKLAGKVTAYSVAGLIAMIIYMSLNAFALSESHETLISYIKLLCTAFIYFALVKSIAFTTGKLERKNRSKKSFLHTVKILLIIVGALLVISLALPLFMVGTVAN